MSGIPWAGAPHALGKESRIPARCIHIHDLKAYLVINTRPNETFAAVNRQVERADAALSSVGADREQTRSNTHRRKGAAAYCAAFGDEIEAELAE